MNPKSNHPWKKSYKSKDYKQERKYVIKSTRYAMRRDSSLLTKDGHKQRNAKVQLLNPQQEG